MHHNLPLRNKLIIMISVMVSFFLVALDQTIIATALGKIVEEFNAFSALAWVVTAYLITTTIMTPIAGKLSDMFGRRNMLLAGVSIFTVGSLLSGMSGDMNQLILWRALQGVGGGILTANAFTVIGDLFAARERGKWQGIIGAVFGVATIIGPLLGGYLTEPHNILSLTTNWRWTFFINIPVGIAALVIIAIFCPPLKHESKPKIDYAGAGLLAFILATLVLALDNTDKIFADFLDTTGMSLLALRAIMLSLVAIGIGVFIWVEKRAKEPILKLDFFKNHNFLLLISMAALIGAAMFGSILYLTQFNQQVFGASPTQSGLMLLPMVAGIMAVSLTTGQLVSKTGKYKRILIAGFGLATLAIGALLTLNPSSPFGQEIAIMIFIGMGLGATMPLLNVAIQNEFEQKDLGVITASNQLFRGLGSTLGIALFGSMLTAGITMSLGDMAHDPYVETLRQSPQAAKMITNPNDADVLLNLNTADIKEKTKNGFDSGISVLKAPAPVKQKLKDDFAAKQQAYSDKVINAFSSSLHRIFVVTSIAMFIAGILSLFLKERPLGPASAAETPGV